MKKFLLIVKTINDCDRIEMILKHKDIKFEKLDGKEDQYHIWIYDEEAKLLNRTFEWISIIKYEL